MNDIFQLADRPDETLFFRRDDPYDVRLGEIVSRAEKDYQASRIVILGCPQDEGVRRNGGRIGAARAPDEIRRAFYKLTNFGISPHIFDLGNTLIGETLEEAHERQTEIVRRILKDGKKIISLGGGNDISYPDCRALSETVGAENLSAFNIDAHFDVRVAANRNSGTPYRQLLEEKWVEPQNFYEIGWQPQANSPVYYEYLKQAGANLIRHDEYRIEDFAERIQKPKFKSQNLFWGFDVDSVRAAHAPGVSAPNAVGFSGKEFIGLAAYAGSTHQTRIIEFTEMNPAYDIDGRTARLVAVAMHRFCESVFAQF